MQDGGILSSKLSEKIKIALNLSPTEEVEYLIYLITKLNKCRLNRVLNEVSSEYIVKHYADFQEYQIEQKEEDYGFVSQ